VLFEILYELILPTKLIIISKVVDFLVCSQLLLVKLGDELFFAPDDIPRIVFYLFIASLLKGFENAVGEVGFIFDGRSS